MIVPLEPKLEGHAEKRFFSFARQMLDRQAVDDPGRIGDLVQSETYRAARLRDIKGQCDEYTACVRVLGDLAQLRWTLVDSGYGLELHSPRPRDDRVSGAAAADRRKEAIRKELRPRLLQQFSDPHVRKFIQRMERPTASSKRKSVRTLIADGAELQARLRKAREYRADDPARAEALCRAVRPYLQLVDSGLRDDHTGLPLGDVWRYFRYTWSIPQTPIPGRNLLYLVRDAAHYAHAVIGIAALSNCAVHLVPRDHAIGWSLSGLAEALTTLFASSAQRTAREEREPALRLQGLYQLLKSQFLDGATPSPAAKRAALEYVTDWLLREVSTAIGEIEHQGLATDSEITAPTPQIVERLRHLGREFASRRQEALAGRGNGAAGVASETPSANVPVDDDVLDLEAKHSSNIPVHNSRRMLVRKKRAFDLARLLDARRVLTAKREAILDPETVLAALEQEDLRIAINTALGAIRSRRIGTNLLEITTCGAVAPYNRMLGGKLVALLLLSPEVAADNQRRYGREATIIRSQLKNARVVPDNNLVWLGTTSLFSHGSSQYERLRLPAGVIAPDQPEIRYTYLGDTTGYGTVQFADDTVRALDGLLRRRRGYRDVNGVFGEGASPRLRKLRAGLDAIGFDSDLVMRHHQGRRIYGAPLVARAGAYLCGLEAEVPSYVSAPESCVDATERIAEFWRRRWLSSRLAHDASWATLGETPPRLLSSTIPLPDPPAPESDEGGDAGDDGGTGGESRLEFWRRLAAAGSKAVSEGLTDAEFHALHIETGLDEYLTNRARDGFSIVLTGNAGDGKTHLARALRRRLAGDAERFEFAFDATAIMNVDAGVTPIVELWRRARNAGKCMVLAINQYPLYKLRQRLPDALPDVSEQIERQWKARLVTSPGVDPADGDSLLLVDLSLRNPLSRDFAGRVLDKMLTDPAVREHARSGSDSNFSFNFDRLGNARVQKRLFKLFERVISSGRRTTVRELWILIARLLIGASVVLETPGAPQAWYSERLFAPDPRFPLNEALQSVADPAAVSHPHIDRGLEDREGILAEQWLPGEVPGRLPATALDPAGDAYRDRFLALKRRFYFEHADGGDQVFQLDPRPHARFHELVRNPDADAEHLSRIVAAINRCYFPHSFDGSRDKLCLWIGHRLDEQPTRSFVAGECIPRERLGISRPQPPGVLQGAFNYLPDHVLLTVSGRHGLPPAEVDLRIDAGLFATLSAIFDGLPRHLVNAGELNRLDTFIDRLRGLAPSPLPEFLVYNAEHVTSSAVKMSTSPGRYVEARRL